MYPSVFHLIHQKNQLIMQPEALDGGTSVYR